MNLHRRLCIFLCLCAAWGAFSGHAISVAQESSRAAGWIAIPAADYQLLRARAYPTVPEPEAPPVRATLTRIDYNLRINGDLAIGQASLTIDVIKDGWVQVPIPSTLLVREARLYGKPIALVASSKTPDAKSAVFTHQGRAVLLLDIVVPVTTNAANESLLLPPALAGITRASIQLPRQGMEVKLTGGFLAEKSASSEESKWLAYGRGNEPMVFSWWKKTEDHRGSQPLRLRGSLTELVGLGEDTTTIQVEVNAEVAQGATQEIKLLLPDRVTINQVAGAMVADWEMKPGELRVAFLEPVEKSARFVIAGEIRTSRDGQIDIPLLRILNAERESGGVAIEVLGAGEITDRKSIGLEGADASDLGALVSSRQSPSLLAFRFRSGDSKAARSLSVNVARYTQESVLMANIEEVRYRILMTEDGKILVQARYAIRNNRKNFLKITLPKDAALWSATLSGNSVRPGQAPDGSLLLPLEKSRAGEEAPAFAAEILYLTRGEKWNESGKLRLSLPILDLPVSRTGLQYFYPPFYKVTSEPGPFRSQPFQAPTSSVLNSGTGGGMGGGVGYGVGNGVGPIVAGTNNELSSTSGVLDPVQVQGGIAPAEKTKSEKDTKALVDKYRAQSYEGKRAGILPISIPFPAFGPTLFLVSELTAENQLPTIDISYEVTGKGGAK